jgi:hypothetical protein
VISAPDSFCLGSRTRRSHLIVVDTSPRAEGRYPVIALGEAGATGPDAIDQAYGLAANLMTQQAAMLAFMDCFHLLSLVVLAGLPLAFFIRRF